MNKKMFSDEKNIFRFTILDTFGIESIKDILVRDSIDNNVILDSESASSLSLSVSYEDIKKIKNIIQQNDGIFKVEDIPIPDWILDGSKYILFFKNDDKEVELSTWNLNAWKTIECKNQYIVLVLKVINEIADVLNKYDLDIKF